MGGEERKLATILVADVVGFSEMMGRDERGTLAILKARTGLIADSIQAHRGRIFGASGDSVIAEFQSPLQAVVCANDFQNRVAECNRASPEDQRMWFRVGINFGDVIIDGNNLFGEGVNVAARLEQLGEPGGICISQKVYEEVRRNLGLPFVDGGLRQLKNIPDPVSIFHVRPAAGSESSGAPASTEIGRAPSRGEGKAEPTRPRSMVPERQSVAVRPFRVSGDEEAQFLAEGLRDGVMRRLGKFSAIRVVSEGEGSRPDYVLEGTVRGRGGRVRMSFLLIDSRSSSQVWSEHYDREGDDVFALEDEVSEVIAAVVRIRLKALAFEILHNTDNRELSVPDLLSKAAGYFVRSPGQNDEAEEILRLAVERAPGSSMAHAMLAFCIYRRFEHSPLALPEPVVAELQVLSARAVTLDPDSYFARLIAALMAQELSADFETALMQAEAALERNPNFTQAQAMAGVAHCHLGRLETGIAQLRHAIDANKEDPHRFRHHRELTLALSLAGKGMAALQTVARLVQLAPELHRNHLVQAVVLQQAGQEERAVRTVAALRSTYPDLTLKSMRPCRFGSSEDAARFSDALRAAGLPD